MQRFRHRLEHILQRADTGKNHGDIQNDGKNLPKRNILQNGGQRDKQQAGTRADIKIVGEASRNNDQRRDHGGNGIEQGGLLRNPHHIFLRG